MLSWLMHMSEYIKQFKIQMVSKVPGLKFRDVSAVETVLVKEGFPDVRVRDERDYVIVKIENREYKYDKWYTKPEHLAEIIKVYYTKTGAPP